MRAIVWNGEEVAREIAAATKAAIDETTAAAAEDAKTSHWWNSRKGQLQEEIVNEPAKVEGTRTTGRFGTTQRRGFYGLFFERRTPFLRPAADRLFPTLAERIKRRREG